MLVAKFDCPACQAVLKPAAPVPSGKKIKCPKCAQVIVVPEPEDVIEEFEEEVETVEEAPSAKKRPRQSQEEEERPSRRRDERDDEGDERPRKKRVEDDEDERPSRRGSARDDNEEEERPREKGKRSKQKASGGAGLKIAIFAGVGLLLLVGLGVGGYFLIAGTGKPGVKAFDEATALLAGVNDQASADAARPSLLSLGQRFRELTERDRIALKKRFDDPDVFKKEVEEMNRDPERYKAKLKQIEKEMEPVHAARRNLTQEAKRVLGVPGGKELLNAFWDAWGIGASSMRTEVIMPAGPRETILSAQQKKFRSIQVGMSEKEVTDLLGSPLLIQEPTLGTRKFMYSEGFIDIKDGKVIARFP